MKKSNLIITIAVVIVLAASSVGAILAASGVFAAGSAPMQATQGTIQFDAPSGIRWNNGKKAFEIFNYAGVSHIASEQYVNATGDVISPTTYGGLGTTEQAAYKEMNGVSAYHIMQDIYYETEAETTAAWADFRTKTVDFGNGDPDGNKGLLDGRGHTLYNFPHKNHAVLFYRVYGTIQNINISSGALIASAVGNQGILSAHFHGVAQNITIDVPSLSSATAQRMGSICGGAYENAVFRSITNYADIIIAVEGSTYVGGIVGILGGGVVIEDCHNFGNITGGIRSAGIVASQNSRPLSIRGCTNWGEINAYSASDLSATNTIAGGIIGLSSPGNNLVVRGCINYGNINGKEGTGAGICSSGAHASAVLVGNANYGEVKGDYAACDLYRTL